MLLEELGLNAKLLTAGFFGGAAYAAVVKRGDAAAQIAAVLAGTFTANYIGPAISQIPHLGDALGLGGSGFVAGVTAMTIVQKLSDIVKARMTQFQATAKGQQKGSP